MLNENKVKMMTKMAIYEKNEGKRMLKMSRYYKGDFVTLGILKSIIASTLAFAVMVIFFALCNMEKIVSEVNTMDYTLIAKKIGTYYIIFLVVFSIIAGIVNAYQYDKSRAGLKKYLSRLNKLERFYNNQNKKRNS
ncbi:MAG: hypothetical protein HFJ03_04265 [Lachnospira sp.]|jgi:magnesium-transporting ATPase (P-type)|nr:hypothetical protein [Lachnospira sp.]